MLVDRLSKKVTGLRAVINPEKTPCCVKMQADLVMYRSIKMFDLIPVSHALKENDNRRADLMHRLDVL